MSGTESNTVIGKSIPKKYKSKQLTSNKSEKSTKEDVAIDESMIRSITDDNLKRSSINEDGRTIFADIDKGMDIVTAATLSPKDLINTKLIFKNNNKSLPTHVLGGMHSLTEEHILEHYNIVDELPTIIKEGYFTKGSYATLVIPDSVLYAMSDMKVVGNENKTSKYKDLDIEASYSTIDTKIVKSDITGISTDTEVVDLKNVINNNKLNIEVTSNLSILKPKTYNSDLSNLGTENKDVGTNLGIMDLDAIAEGDGDGIAFRKYIPTEALTPIHAPGEPSNHLGYYLALDKNNVPVTNENLMVLNSEMKNDYENATGIIKETKESVTEGLFKNKAPTLQNIDAVYSLILQRSLAKAVKDGGLGIMPEIDRQSEIYSLLFKNALTENNIKLVYIPAKYLTYYAYEYRPNGTGKSILEKCTLLFSMRSMLMMTRILGNLNNTLPTTVVDVSIPDTDNDPKSTMAIIKSLVFQRGANNVPVFNNDMGSTIDWIAKYGYKFNFKHKTLPNIEYDKRQEVNEKVIPDIELEEDIRDQIFTIIGITSDYVTSKSHIEFAAEALIEDKFLTRRVIKIQDTTMKFVTSDVCKIVRYDNNLYTKYYNLIKPKLKAIIKSINKSTGSQIVVKKDYTEIEEATLIRHIIYIYTKTLKISLPRPEEDADDKLAEAFERKLDAIETATDVFLSSDYLDTSIFGDVTDDIENIKNGIVYTKMRAWCVENNYMTDLANIVDYVENNKLVSDIIESTFKHRDDLSKVLLKYFKINKKAVEKLNVLKEKIEDGTDEPEVVPEEPAEETPEETPTEETPDELPEEPTDDLPEEPKIEE